MSRTAKEKGTRQSYENLGLSPERLFEIRARCRSGAFDMETMRRACSGFEWVGDFIILSAAQGISFDRLEFTEKLGRIPCGRSDFYGYRRKFYSNLDQDLERGAQGEEI